MRLAVIPGDGIGTEVVAEDFQCLGEVAPDIESIYLMAAPEFSFLSSSGVKEVAMFGGDIGGLVPDRVAARLQEELKR